MITEAQQQLDKLDTRKTRQQHNLVIPLSFVDDCNSVRVSNKKFMDKCLEDRCGMEWDKDMGWKDGTHLGVNLDRRKHQKYRTQKTKEHGVW